MIDSLPCSSCTALCYGPLAIIHARLARIRAYLKTMPKSQKNRLARQVRGQWDFGFLDMVTYRCTIYPVRPCVCEAFGRVPEMQCPRVSGLVQIIPEFAVDRALRAECESEIVLSSEDFDWRKM